MLKIGVVGFAILAAGSASAQQYGEAYYQGISPGIPSAISAVSPNDFIEVTRSTYNPNAATVGRYITTKAWMPVGTFIGRQEFQSYVAMFQRNTDRFVEASALASAMTIMPPNAGDRFSVTFSGGAVESKGAGSVSVSVRVTDQTTAFAAYARSQSMNAFKGGVSLSFK